MSTRRDFMRQTLVAGAALGLGLWRGWQGPSTEDSWNLVVRAPREALDEVWGLVRRLGGDADPDAWETHAARGPADVALLRGGRLLEPSRWPAAALELRRSWQGREADLLLHARAGRQGRAREALVWGPTGLLARLDLQTPGETRMEGRDGHRMVLGVHAGQVAVVESTCRHGHCRRQGAQGLAGGRLVCAPAGLLVELEG